MSYADNLAEAAQDAAPADAPKKKERAKSEAITKSYPQLNEDGTPILDAEGNQVYGPEKSKFKKAKAKKEPKPIEYELNEDGTQKLDEAGNPIPKKKVRQPKLDADGNPIPRQVNTYLPSWVLRITDAGLKANYQPESKRGKIFASIKDNMTVEEFYNLNGGKKVSHTFLVWYVNEAKVVEVVQPEEA